MGTIRIENKGKNLWAWNNPREYIDNWNDIVVSYYKAVGQTLWAKSNDKNFRKAPYIYLKSGSYILSLKIKDIIGQDNFRIEVKEHNGNTLLNLTGSQVGEYSGTFSVSSQQSNMPIHIKIHAYGTDTWVVYENFQLEEGSSATEYEPPRNDVLEFNQELFGYAGVYDELHDDGTLIKRWQRESITITSGAGTVSKTGTGTCILINETDGLPYEGTVSGINVTTSAPDGAYTIIYQLATPEIIDLNYDGELILCPGENNLILPDLAVASISGARKYLEG